jgi:hypothetical protein
MALRPAERRRRAHRLEERRGAVWQHAALAGLIACLPAAAPACDLPEYKRIQGARHSLAYRTTPARIAIGEPFAVEIAVCPGTGALVATAHMPEHKHGMNYKPVVKPLGNGRFRAEGWLFHMPGRWEFLFDVGGERITDSLRLE